MRFTCSSYLEILKSRLLNNKKFRTHESPIEIAKIKPREILSRKFKKLSTNKVGSISAALSRPIFAPPDRNGGAGTASGNQFHLTPSDCPAYSVDQLITGNCSLTQHSSFSLRWL